MLNPIVLPVTIQPPPSSMSDVNKPLTLGASDIDPRGVADGGDDLATLVRHSKGLTRVAANRFWEDRLRGAPSASSEQLAQLASLVSQEHKHVACLRAAHEQASGQPSTHDHTKDTWYMVVTVLVFSMQLKELVFDVMDDIIGEHVTAEPHHEAYFERTKEVPTADNVLEMALDRLARNQQKNGGVYNWEQMERFLPKWPRHLADMQEELTQQYKDYCQQHSSLVRRAWQQLQ